MTLEVTKKKSAGIHAVYGRGKLKGNGQKTNGPVGFNSYRPVIATLWRLAFDKIATGIDVQLPYPFGMIGVRKKKMRNGKHSPFLYWQTASQSTHPTAQDFSQNVMYPQRKYPKSWMHALENGQEYETYDRRTAIKID